MSTQPIREPHTTIRTTVAGFSACTIITGSHVVAAGELARYQTSMLTALVSKLGADELIASLRAEIQQLTIKGASGAAYREYIASDLIARRVRETLASAMRCALNASLPKAAAKKARK
jgi:hypothetical protein